MSLTISPSQIISLDEGESRVQVNLISPTGRGGGDASQPIAPTPEPTPQLTSEPPLDPTPPKPPGTDLVGKLLPALACLVLLLLFGAVFAYTNHKSTQQANQLANVQQKWQQSRATDLKNSEYKNLSASTLRSDQASLTDLTTENIDNSDTISTTDLNVSGSTNLEGLVTENIITKTIAADGSKVTNVNAAKLNGHGQKYYTNADNISSGTLADARLSTNVTLQGNTFNVANKLLQLDSQGLIANSLLQPSVSLLGQVIEDEEVNNNLTIDQTGSVAWLALQGYPSGCNPGEAVTAIDDTLTCAPFAGGDPNDFIHNGTSVQTADFNVTGDGTIGGTITAALFSGSGSGLTGLDAGNISSGTLADNRLSSNVAFKNIDNNFSADQTINGGLTTTGEAYFNTGNIGEAATFGSSAHDDHYIKLRNSVSNGAMVGYYANTNALLLESGTNKNVEIRTGGTGTFGSGSVALRILPNQNVGLGQSSPNNKLELAASTSSTGGIGFGTDTNLYRSAANTLRTDDAFHSSSDVVSRLSAASQTVIGAVGPSSESGIRFGSASDTNLYRSAANTLATDDNFTVDNGSATQIFLRPSASATDDSFISFANGRSFVGYNGTTLSTTVRGMGGKNVILHADAGVSDQLLRWSTAGKLEFGSAFDTNLYRTGVGVLRTDGKLSIATGSNTAQLSIKSASTTTPTLQLLAQGSQTADFLNVMEQGGANSYFAINSTGGLNFGGGSGATDTNLYRGAANRLQTDDEFAVVRSAATNLAFGTYVSGDAQWRFYSQADGKLQWGNGTNLDTNLYRSTANALKTDDDFLTAGRFIADGLVIAENPDASKTAIGGIGPSGEAGILFGNGNDTTLYRSAANTLKTDDSFVIQTALTNPGDSYNALGLTYTPTITANSTSTTYGSYIQANTGSNSFNNGSVNASRNQAVGLQMAGGTTDGLRGAWNTAEVDASSTGAYTLLYGALDKATHGGSGAVNTAYGTRGEVEASGSGSISTARSSYFRILNTGSGTIANAYGTMIGSPSGGGAITSLYGVHIQAQAGAGVGTAWGLYSAGASDLNYFAGNVGLGVTNPTTAKLQFAAATTAVGGIQFGTDTNLYRAGADNLRTDDRFDAGGKIVASYNTTDQVQIGTTNAGILFGNLADTNLYRVASNTLKTDSNFQVAGNSYVDTSGTASKLFFGSSADTNLYRATTNVLQTDSEFRVKVAKTDLSSTIQGTYINPTFNPASDNGSPLYVIGANIAPQYISTVSKTVGGSSLFGAYVNPQITSSGGLAAVVGVDSVLETRPGSTATITSGIGLRARTPILVAGSAIGSTFGLSIQNQGATGVTNAIGIDVQAQNGATTSNIGVRIAKGDTYSLQLSDTGGSAAGGITFASDTNLYRSGANTLRTDDHFGTQRSLSTDYSYYSYVAGEATSRFLIRSDGLQLWGDGTNAVDTNLYRSAANTLATDDAFQVRRTNAGDVALATFQGAGSPWYVRADGRISWGDGSTYDTTLYRGVADELRTDDLFTVSRASSGNSAFQAYQAGDGNVRYKVLADGKIQWGDGTATQDTNLYRSAAGVLRTDGTFNVGTSNAVSLSNSGLIQATRAATNNVINIFATGDANARLQLRNDSKINFGDGTNPVDTNLYRSAAGMLKTDSGLTVAGTDQSWNAAAATLYVGQDAGTSRSINAAGTVNTGGTDYAEYIPWSGPKPEPGSVVEYKGSAYVVSSQEQASFVGGDVYGDDNSILVAFVGQVKVRVSGQVSVGDILVDNGDGTAKAVSPDTASLTQLFGKLGIAQEDSNGGTVMAAIGTTASSLTNVASSLQQGGSDFANLNVSGNLTVGDLTVNSDIAVQGNIVLGPDSHIVGNDNTRGEVTVDSGETTKEYEFPNAYDNPPNVVVTPTSNPGGSYWVSDITTHGFTIHLSEAAAGNIKFNFQAQE